jgi:predicted DNA-binding transcriptional regulator AlpA
MSTIQQNTTGRNALSIEEFCHAHGFSRATYFNLRKLGKAPREMRVGARVLVSTESAKAWRRQMEACKPGSCAPGRLGTRNSSTKRSPVRTAP